MKKWLKAIASWAKRFFNSNTTQSDYQILSIEYGDRGNLSILNRDTPGAVITLRVRHIESTKKDLLIAVDNLYRLTPKRKNPGKLEEYTKVEVYYTRLYSHRYLFAWVPQGVSPDKLLYILAIVDGEFIDKKLAAFGETGEDKVAYEVALSIAREILKLKPIPDLFWPERVARYNWKETLLERFKHRLGKEPRIKRIR